MGKGTLKETSIVLLISRVFSYITVWPALKFDFHCHYMYTYLKLWAIPISARLNAWTSFKKDILIAHTTVLPHVASWFSYTISIMVIYQSQGKPEGVSKVWNLHSESSMFGMPMYM